MLSDFLIFSISCCMLLILVFVFLDCPTPPLTGSRTMSNDKQNQPQTGSPVQRLVGQLRELLAKATPGPWEVPKLDNEIRTKDHGALLHCDGDTAEFFIEADAKLVVAAINNLSSLLKIVEVADQWNRATTFEDSMGHLSRLRRALRLLPNDEDQRAGPAPGSTC